MEKKKCIIVIEDEAMVQQSLVEYLTTVGYDVFPYDMAEPAIEGGMMAQADAVIMDIHLPGMNGWEATEIIKQENTGLPVIMLTAYSDLNYRVQGFDKGADDYIIKPFFMQELAVRLKAVLKRYEMVPGSQRFYSIGELIIDTKAKTVIRDKKPVNLSLTEFNLLALLAENAGSPVSKDQILKKIWKGRNSVGDNTIEVYINLLRNKIDHPFTYKMIHTKPGFGYYLASAQ